MPSCNVHLYLLIVLKFKRSLDEFVVSDPLTSQRLVCLRFDPTACHLMLMKVNSPTLLTFSLQHSMFILLLRVWKFHTTCNVCLLNHSFEENGFLCISSYLWFSLSIRWIGILFISLMCLCTLIFLLILRTILSWFQFSENLN